MDIIFCHGLESGPHGRKYHALIDAGFSVDSPDFQGMKLAERVAKLQGLLSQRNREVLLIGSSYGGITALLASMTAIQAGTPIVGLLMLAPALEFDEAIVRDTKLQALTRTHIIHGRNDDVVPIEGSRRFATKEGATLIEVEDDHRLAKSLDRMLWETKYLLAITNRATHIQDSS